MIALSTVWGQDRFETYSALFAEMRETFHSFEAALPPWPGRRLPSADVYRAAGVRCAGLMACEPGFNPAGAKAESGAALRMMRDATAAARASGAPGVCVEGGQASRLEGWLDFRKALFDAAFPGREAVIAAGLSHRARNWEGGLEALARTLHEACGAAGGVELRLQTPADPSGFPSPEELGLLFGEVGHPGLKYCHVAGRAAFLKRAAGWEPEAWLEIARDRTSAVVVDDGGALSHGMLPGTGETDYAALARLAPASAVFVLRPPARSAPGELLAAASLLKSAGPGMGS